VKVRLGTATRRRFPVYGAAFIEAVHRFDSGLEIEHQHQGQHRERAHARSGHVDIALVQGECARVAERIGRPPRNLRIVTAMYPTAGMFWCVPTRLTAASRPFGQAIAWARKARAW